MQSIKIGLTVICFLVLSYTCFFGEAIGAMGHQLRTMYTRNELEFSLAAASISDKKQRVLLAEYEHLFPAIDGLKGQLIRGEMIMGLLNPISSLQGAGLGAVAGLILKKDLGAAMTWGSGGAVVWGMVGGMKKMKDNERKLYEISLIADRLKKVEGAGKATLKMFMDNIDESVSIGNITEAEAEYLHTEIERWVGALR